MIQTPNTALCPCIWWLKCHCPRFYFESRRKGITGWPFNCSHSRFCPLSCTNLIPLQILVCVLSKVDLQTEKRSHLFWALSNLMSSIYFHTFYDLSYLSLQICQVKTKQTELRFFCLFSVSGKVMHYTSFHPCTKEVEQGWELMIKWTAGPKGQHMGSRWNGDGQREWCYFSYLYSQWIQ